MKPAELIVLRLLNDSAHQFEYMMKFRLEDGSIIIDGIMKVPETEWKYCSVNLLFQNTSLKQTFSNVSMVFILTSGKILLVLFLFWFCWFGWPFVSLGFFGLWLGRCLCGFCLVLGFYQMVEGDQSSDN